MVRLMRSPALTLRPIPFITREEDALFQALHDHDMELKSEEQNKVRNAGELTPEEAAGACFSDTRHADEDSPLVLRDQSVMPLFRKRGLLADDYRGLSFGGFCRAMVHGAKTDVERRALSEGTDSAGGYTVPAVLMARLIDGLRKKATVMNAGAVTVPLTSDDNSIAKLASDPTASWRAENALVGTSDPTFSRIQFIPKTLAVMVKASRELLQDSLNAEAALMNAFAKSMALEIDRVALLGDGTGDEPTGIGYDSGVTANDLVLGDVLADYDPFVDSIQALEDRNANAEAAVSIMAPRTKADLAKLVDTTGQPLRKPQSIESLPMRATTQIPVDETYMTRSDATRIITGDFSQLFVGIRSELRVEILRERFADNLQYGFLAWMRADIALAHAESFQQVTDVLPD
jgi:HK97 family phage major capsid protein